MQLDASLSWLALTLTPGLAARLCARLLKRFGSPEAVFRASRADLESCHLPDETAEAILKKKAFPRAEKELAGIRKIAGCSLLNWTEPEYRKRCCKFTIRRSCYMSAATRKCLVCPA